eukprot:COSAG02_NODE_62975_length_264_cov_0.933333_1_plen_21_part_01
MTLVNCVSRNAPVSMDRAGEL